jgi:hypothetical protein
VWGAAAAEILRKESALRPDIVVAFFTPRGPLLAARRLSERLRIPWIADLQDPALEGTSPQLRPLVSKWMRHTLRGAGAVVQVSPEWADLDSRLLGREVIVMRHAVPAMAKSLFRGAKPSSRVAERIRLLYAGSINPYHQNAGPLMQAIDLVNRRASISGGPSIELTIAGLESTFNAFLAASQSENARAALRSLGWLDHETLMRNMFEADALVVIPSALSEREMVPSKLFEYFATSTPILIAGRDSGGITSLMSEWNHPYVLHETAEQIARALTKLIDRDMSGMLHASRCSSAPFSEGDLCAAYTDLAERFIVQTPTTDQLVSF